MSTCYLQKTAWIGRKGEINYCVSKQINHFCLNEGGKVVSTILCLQMLFLPGWCNIVTKFSFLLIWWLQVKTHNSRFSSSLKSKECYFYKRNNTSKKKKKETKEIWAQKWHLLKKITIPQCFSLYGSSSPTQKTLSKCTNLACCFVWQ